MSNALVDWSVPPEMERRAEELMTAFYLSQGFAEPPQWEDLSIDFRNGFRGIVVYLVKEARK